MELAPRYCRSCGSRILVKNVCHNCNNDPLKGDNYCYDCGALTPNADNCLRCGARYKRNFPIKPVLIIGGLLIVTIAVAGYFLSRSNQPITITDSTLEPETTQTATTRKELPGQDTFVNNPADSATPVNTPAIIVTPPKDSVAKPAVADSIKKIAASVFTSQELTVHNARCRYFTKNNRSNVLFFIAGSSAFIKLDGKIHDLKRKRKGVDVAAFGGNGYEATIRINGLSGSDKEWLAACTLVIKDIQQNKSASYKVYSSCIEL